MHDPCVYLLHFDEPINPDHPCRHYIGSAEDLESRLDQHMQGQAARLTQVARERGIGFRLAATWPKPPGSFQLEKQLKRYRNAPRFCPICCAAAGRPLWIPPPARAALAAAAEAGAPGWDFGMVPDPPRRPRVDWYEISLTRNHRACAAERAARAWAARPVLTTNNDLF